MSFRSACQIGLCDVCFHVDADSCSDGRSLSLLTCAGELMHRLRAYIQVRRQVFSRTFEWEERVVLCTKELVMFEVAMEYYGDRFCTSDRSTVSAQGNFFQLSSGAAARQHERSPCTTKSSKTSCMMATGAKGDDDMCGA